MPAALGFLLFTLGAPLSIVNFITIGFGANLINLAIGIGLSLLASLLLRPQFPRRKPSDGQQTIRQAVPVRWKHYGELRVGGPLWWFFSKRATKSLYVGMLINQGRISEYLSFHIDDKIVGLNGTKVTTEPFNGVNTRIHSRLGVPTETEYAPIKNDFGVNRVRGDGIATILGIFKSFADPGVHQENYPNGQPHLRVTARMSVVWDLRDPTQIRTDPATWKYSDNPVICVLDYFLSADGWGIPYARFENNLEQWKEAADICDSLVWSVEDAEFEKRFRIAATYLFSDNPAETLRRMAEVFDARIWQTASGQIGITVGIFKLPTITLSDDVIIRFDLQRGEDRLFAVAGVRAQFMSPAHDYREFDAEPWPDGPTVAALSEDRIANLDLMWCPSHGQARRLMERHYEKARAKWNGKIVCNLGGLNAIDERIIQVKISELGIDDTFEIDHYAIDIARNEISLDLTSIDELIDPIRPDRPTSGLFNRGFGIVASIDPAPSLNFNTVLDGEKPLAGDLVVISIVSDGEPTWANPAGWTIIANTIPSEQTTYSDGTGFSDGTAFLEATQTRFVDLFKEVTQADIDAPAAPLGDATDTMIHWRAFNPADVGAPTLDGYIESYGFNTGPLPVEHDGAPIGQPFAVFSAHSANAGIVFDAAWTGATIEGRMRESIGNVTQTSRFKTYPAGTGVEITATMPQIGNSNLSRIYAIKYI